MTATNTFQIGMNTDLHPKYQKDGSYRFALNSVLETHQGELPYISTEGSNQLCAEGFPSTKSIIGHVLTDNEEVVLFLYDPSGEHEIGVYNPSRCLYTSVAIDNCLNFSDKYPVNALFRIRNGCERVIYFTDNYNEYRVVNLTDTSYWVDDDKSILSCDRIAFYRDHNIPCISLFTGEGDLGVKDGGGSLKVGVYYFAIRYLDYEQNPTDWFLITRPVAVGDEPYNLTNNAQTLSFYDGGSNVEGSPFYVSPTNKSIKLLINNLDYPNFAFYQIAAIKRTGDAGEIEGVDILFPEGLTQSSGVTFTYTGLSSQIFTQTSLDEILATRSRTDKVVAHAQNDNKLFLAGIENNQWNWSDFQRYASKVKVEWTKDDTTSPVDTYVRQGGYYFLNSSFMEDEVYALGIMYVMEDGTLSPVFPIPGRPADTSITGSNPYIGTNGVATDTLNWDTGEAQYGDTYNAAKLKRWQHISTATKYTSGPIAGLLGYWEATTTYPEVNACTDHADGYWGRDWTGSLIEPGVTKIRHHRMPGPELRDSAEDATGFRTGLKFSNVEYPEGAIQHYFVYGDRTFEKTIVAKGALIPLYFPSPVIANLEAKFSPDRLAPKEISYVNTVPDPDVDVPVKVNAFICSDGLLKDKSIAGKYFRIEKVYYDTLYDTPQLGEEIEIDALSVPSGYFYGIPIAGEWWDFDKYDLPTDQFNYIITQSVKLPKAPYSTDAAANHSTAVDPINFLSIVNNSVNISPQFLSFERVIDDHEQNGKKSWPNKILFGSVKIDADPFNNLYNIIYKRMHNCPTTAASPASSFTAYGGDTFVSRLTVYDWDWQQVNLDKDVNFYLMRFLTQDSGVNYEMRHGGTNDTTQSYFKFTRRDAAGTIQLGQFMETKYHEVIEGIMDWHLDTYAYNDSFSYQESIENYYPIPFEYEFCNECRERFPYRTYYSETDNGETSEDKYRIVRPNNYKDIDGSSGPITDMFVAFDQLYLATTNSMRLIPTKPQTIQSNENIIYLGTGETLSLPFKELKTTDYAFGGLEFFKSRVNTEYGTFYVDSLSARPFLLTNELNDLSLKGFRNFWQENGKVEFVHQFKKFTGESYPILSTSSPIGVGYISTYDPRFKRVLVHKRDFKLLPEFEESLTYTPQDTDSPRTLPNTIGLIHFNNFNFYYIDKFGLPILIDFENSEFFENKSFTLSYSFLTGSWVSFHSYLPSYMFNNYSDLFSNGIYKHNRSDNFREFYGTTYPHIIDFATTLHPNEIKYVNGIQYSSNTTRNDGDINKTFNKIVAYNSKQSTGTLNLIWKDLFSTDVSNTEALVSRVDNKFRVNNLRDLTIDKSMSVWSTAWADLQTSPYSFIDKVPNPFNINYNKSAFEQSRLRDYFVGVRLIFDDQDSSLKITTDMVNTMSANRNR